MAIYDMNFTNNVTNPVDIFVGISNAVSASNQYLIGYLILFSFFLIFLVVMLKYEFNEILIIDGFLTTILAILLYGAEMVPGMVIVWPALIMFFAMVFFFIRS